MPGYQRFFAELKRRKVFRVTAVYGAGAFAVLQVADLAFPRLGLPDWTVTFVDTGMQSVVADRLLRVRDYLEDEDIFLVNYSDGLTDLPLDKYIADFQASDKIAQFLLVQPPLSYHRVEIDQTDTVTEIRPIFGSDLWINGGYFVFRKEFLNYIEPGDEIVMEPFFRLMAEGKLAAIKYDGFWAPMDTFKDKRRLEELWVSGRAPWELWKDERPF